MSVLFCSVHDWANAGFLLSKALRTVGVAALSVASGQSGFGYSDKSKKWKTLPALQALANEATAVVMMHSEQLFGKLNLKGKRVAVFHGGTTYRRHSRTLNPIFNKVCDVALIQTADLLNTGVKNPVWLMPPVDVDALQPGYKSLGSDGLVFAHYPSKAQTKGTQAIRKAMRALRADFRCSADVLPHDKHIDRVRSCDVYIERMSLERDHIPTGVWGMSAMEASALGKIVITNDLWRDDYEKEFGPCPMIVANSCDELKEAVERLQAMTTEEILNLQTATRDWVVRTHSYEPVGKRLKELLL